MSQVRINCFSVSLDGYGAGPEQGLENPLGMHLAFAPVLLGEGEQLLHGINLRTLGYRVTEHVPTASATHVVFRRDSA